MKFLREWGWVIVLMTLIVLATTYWELSPKAGVIHLEE